MNIIETLKTLASGINPETGKPLPKSSIIYRAETLQMLDRIIGELGIIAELNAPEQPDNHQASEAPPLQPINDDDYDDGLFKKLKAWRLAQANELKVPAFTIAPNSALKHIACAPQIDTIDQLLDLKGIGPATIKKYGESLLSILSEHRNQTNDSVSEHAPQPTVRTTAEIDHIKLTNNIANGRPLRTGFKWSKDEKLILKSLIQGTIPITIIAEKIERTAKSIAVQLEKQELITAEERLKIQDYEVKERKRIQTDTEYHPTATIGDIIGRNLSAPLPEMAPPF